MDKTKQRTAVAPAKGDTRPGGPVAVAAMCQRLGRWARIRAERTLDPQRHRTRDFVPAVMAAPLVASLCCGAVASALGGRPASLAAQSSRGSPRPQRGDFISPFPVRAAY